MIRYAEPHERQCVIVRCYCGICPPPPTLPKARSARSLNIKGCHCQKLRSAMYYVWSGESYVSIQYSVSAGCSGSVALFLLVNYFDISEAGEWKQRGNWRGGGEVSGKLFLLYWPCSCLCTSLQPVSERDRCPQNSCPCPCVVFSFFYCSFFLSRPPFCISSIQLTTPPHCNFCVTHFTNTHTSSSTQWAAKLVHEVSCSYHYISIGVSQYECVCVLLFQLYLGFLLSLLFDLFSPFSRSPRGPGSCYLNVFL